MEWSRCLLVLCLVAGAVCDDDSSGSGLLAPKDFDAAMISHFSHLDKHRSPRPLYNENWLQTRSYIKKAFEDMGLTTEMQCFNTTAEFVSEDGGTTITKNDVEACNVIGSSPGDSTSDMIVLGAHYDTSEHDGVNVPLRENGAGVAALIEVARAYQQSALKEGYHRNNPAIFVAFDINNTEEPSPAKGHSGVWYFVHEWLHHRLATSTLRGAVILDSISTYNMEPNTQELPADFSQVFPEEFLRITVNGSSKGDFLAAVTTEGTQDFLTNFNHAYYRDRMARPYRLQELVTAGEDFGSGETFEAMTSYEAKTFWEHTPTLPCVLLTDSRGMRTLPTPDAQCTTDCTDQFANDQRMNFLYHSYSSLVRFLLEEQTTLTEKSGAGAAWASLLTTLGCLVLSLFVSRQ